MLNRFYLLLYITTVCKLCMCMSFLRLFFTCVYFFTLTFVCGMTSFTLNEYDDDDDDDDDDVTSVIVSYPIHIFV